MTDNKELYEKTADAAFRHGAYDLAVLIKMSQAQDNANAGNADGKNPFSEVYDYAKNGVTGAHSAISSYLDNYIGKGNGRYLATGLMAGTAGGIAGLVREMLSDKKKKRYFRSLLLGTLGAGAAGAATHSAYDYFKDMKPIDVGERRQPQQ